MVDGTGAIRLNTAAIVKIRGFLAVRAALDFPSVDGEVRSLVCQLRVVVGDIHSRVLSSFGTSASSAPA